MKTCSTCDHWAEKGDSPYTEDEDLREDWPHAVRAGMRECHKPAKVREPAVLGTSFLPVYADAVLTGPGFVCGQWEEK